jgi:NADPH-dependent glutamate synthase beta subunit-like oxidoreductase
VEGRTHRPEHDEARCAACSICVALCPAVGFPEYRLDPQTVRGAAFGASALIATRDEVRPCRAACPLHQDVPLYVGALARGDAAASLDLIRATNPLPAVCGTVCNRSCERACVRARVDEAVPIRALKRAAVEELRRLEKLAPSAGAGRPPASRSVAIVGSGPAGLAAAHDLALAGVRVVVLDEQPRVGGMPACAVPSFILPPDLLAADIDVLRALGVEFRTGVRVGRDVNLSSLREEYDAVLLAVGAWRGLPLGLAGEKRVEGVIDHVDFARQTALEGPERRRGPAIVVGGNAAAFACARIAVRLGCKPVTVAYQRPLDRIPADAEAVADAVEEGVRLVALVRVVELGAEAGRLTAVRLERLREEEPDAWGHRPLIPTGEPPVDMPVSMLVVALDRAPDLRLLGGMPGLARTPFGFLAVDPATGMTVVPGLFAAGDVVTGPKGVVEAVAAGRKVAAAVARWVADHPRELRPPTPTSRPVGEPRRGSRPKGRGAASAPAGDAKRSRSSRSTSPSTRKKKGGRG